MPKLKITFLALTQFLLINVPLSHQQDDLPMVGRCKVGTKILNDCNWCTCVFHRHHYRYDCQARECGTVDMFGHFNDAIKDIHAGMEGHGSWRSQLTACEPLVHYKSKDLYCICNEDGYWPHPVCRDHYRVFYNIRPLKKSVLEVHHRCVPQLLYLVGCNTCLCPADGKLDVSLCTKKKCSAGDPVLEQGEAKIDDNLFYNEVYTTCAEGAKMDIGCHKCTCRAHNRLVCKKCPETPKPLPRPQGERLNYCSSMAVNHVFNVDCNLCFCDAEGNMLCSVKTCLGKSVVTRRSSHLLNLDLKLEPALTAPHDLYSCTIGTEFLNDCNLCRCQSQNGTKIISCTMKTCDPSLPALEVLKTECVVDSYYETSCYICTCNRMGGVVWQVCELNWECVSRKEVSTGLEAVHGYCRPLHVYKSGCNPCRCLDDGKVLMCTTQLCDSPHEDDRPDGDVVEVIPIIADNKACRTGQAYQIDCNFCFCLKNGNAICTTNECSYKP